MPDSYLDFLSRNLSLIQQHKPYLLPLAEDRPLPCADLPPVDESFGPFVQSLPPDEESLVFLVGLGAGHEARQLLARRDLQTRLLIIEPQIAMFQAALRQTDLSPILQHPEVRLFIGEDADLGKIFQQEEDALRALPHLLFCNTILQKRFPELYGALCRQAQEALLQFKSQVDTVEQRGPLLFSNTLQNCPRLCRTVHVRALAGIAQGSPAICVAAGPSLTKNIGLLQERQRQALIIATDSAAKILLDHGITPHCIVTIDPIPASLQKLQAVMETRPDLPLIWTPEAHPETVERFVGGPHFVMPSVNDFFRLYLAPLINGQQSFPNLVSVTHAATQLAILAGCDPLIFIGLDLALTDGKDHADGSPVRWSVDHNRIPIPAWNGGVVETIPVLLSQLRSLEAIIGQHPTIRFIDATEGGARIKGTLPTPLAEVLADLPATDHDWEKRIFCAFQAHARPQPEDIAQILGRLRTAMQKSRQVAQRGLREGKEARRLWNLAKAPAKRARAMPRFKKAIIVSGEAMDRLRAATELTNALFPLRAREHHRLIYAREKFLRHAPTKTPEERIFEELALNLDYFTSWLATLKEAEKLLAPALATLKANR